MQYNHITMYHSYICPKCKSILKRDKAWDGGNDGCITFASYVMFFPIWLIVWIVKLASKSSSEKRRKVNSHGEEIIFCRHCHSYVAITSTGTRLLLSEQDIFERIKTSIINIQKHDILYTIIHQDAECIDEKLELEFSNKENKNIRIIIEKTSSHWSLKNGEESFFYSPIRFENMVLSALVPKYVPIKEKYIEGETVGEYMDRMNMLML